MSKSRANQDSPAPSSSTDSTILPAPGSSRVWLGIASVPVLALAFLLASFPARNSEIWQHLAAGRGLLAGTYWFGVDPFAYTTAGATWVNHAWLYDVVLFLVHRCCGERLVIFNALLATVLAVLMLLSCGWPRTAWTSLLSVALALVCLGPHLALQPTMISYLLLAFTVWWLDRCDRAGDWSLRAQVPLFVAQLFWANSDEWFLLGPITVGLYWLGSIVRPAPRIGWPIAAGMLAVCVLNPHRILVFKLPSSLVDPPLAAERAVSTIDQLRALHWPDLPVPIVAYVLLAVLSLMALAANRSLKAVPFALVWAVLLGLSLYRAAAVPFFAIVACQVLAANWQAVRDRRLVSDAAESRRLAWLEPLFVTVALWALAPLAFPGWLQGTSQHRSWSLYPDPSMKHLAEQIAAWREQGQLGESARGYNLSAEMAHYLEWFCPQEKVFLDGRANLFSSEVVHQFLQVQQVLSAETGAKPAAADEARAVLRQWQCTHLLVADPVDRRLALTLRNLWQQPQEWVLADLHGRTALFAWQSPGQPSLGLAPIDLQHRAFRPAEDEKAPGMGIQQEPGSRPWWDYWDWSLGDSGLDRDEAAAYIVNFESLRQEQFQRERAGAIARSTAVLLAAAGPHNAGAPNAAGLRPLDLVLDNWQAMANPQDTPLHLLALQRIVEQQRFSDQGPPGSILLAVRAARRALHENPDDGLAHLRLGRAYNYLEQQTMEQGLNDQSPLLEQLRRVQSLVALRRAARLRPDLQSAHELFADICLKARSYDLALPHVQEQLRLGQEAGPQATESPDQFAARIDRLSTLEQQLGKQVRDLLNLVDTQAFEMGAYRKALFAEGNGLPGYALEQLLKSNYAEFGREGATLQLYLLLHAGRTDDFRTLTDPAQEAVLGPFNYHWMQTLLAAADGNYDLADEHLQRLVGFEAEASASRARATGNSTAVLDGLQVLLGSSNNPWQWLFQLRGSGPFASPPAGAIQDLRRESDLHCVRGMLALESGEIDAARQAFRDCLAAWNGAGGASRLARHYLRLTVEE